MKTYRFELVRLHHTGARTFTCEHCGKQKSQGGDGKGVYADLNGLAFKDYYCAACVAALTKPCPHDLDDHDRCKLCGEDFAVHLALKGAGLL